MPSARRWDWESCSGAVNVGFYFDFLIVVAGCVKKPYNGEL